jgi:hypothetical protein
MIIQFIADRDSGRFITGNPATALRGSIKKGTN